MSEQIEAKPIAMCEKGQNTRMAFLMMPTEWTLAVYQYHLSKCPQCRAWFDEVNAQAQRAEHPEVENEA